MEKSTIYKNNLYNYAKYYKNPFYPAKVIIIMIMMITIKSAKHAFIYTHFNPSFTKKLTNTYVTHNFKMLDHLRLLQIVIKK